MKTDPPLALPCPGGSSSFPYPTPEQQRQFCLQYTPDEWGYLCLDQMFLDLFQLNLYAAKVHSETVLNELRDLYSELRRIRALE